MLGLRTKENDRFKNFFEKVQEKASSLDSVFFLTLENAKIYKLIIWRLTLFSDG